MLESVILGTLNVDLSEMGTIIIIVSEITFKSLASNRL